ncbi:MAG: hypothetical protein LBS11_09155 [Oscillospiraceae bacterium]|jgi:hypothetical protein|nr:hypothetical protein [Oscillospiraceae bacterium]
MRVFGELGGIIEYERRVTLRGVYLLAALMALVLTAVLVIPALVPGGSLVYSGVSDSGMFPIFMVVTMLRAARKDTPFLVARPLARRSVWLGLAAHMVILTLVLAALRAVYALLGYSMFLQLSRVNPGVYRFSAETGWEAWKPFTPNQTLPAFWKAIQDIVSAGALAYCYGCLLARWKGWTIGLSVGLPALGFVVFVLPVVIAIAGDFERIVDSVGQSSLETASAMLLVMKWVDTIQKIMDWLWKYFDWLFWGVVALAVPASWFTTRSARHTV